MSQTLNITTPSHDPQCSSTEPLPEAAAIDDNKVQITHRNRSNVKIKELATTKYGPLKSNKISQKVSFRYENK